MVAVKLIESTTATPRCSHPGEVVPFIEGAAVDANQPGRSKHDINEVKRQRGSANV